MEVNDLTYKIGSGVEGDVYYYNNYAVKIFNNLSKNKIDKINILKEIVIDNFIFPIDFVTKNDIIIGYYMDYINTKLNMHDVITNKKTLRGKIEILQEIETIFKKAHQNKILIIDMNPRNFLYNGYWNFIDCDNYKVNGLQNDINPLYFYRYYKSKITETIDINFDKFQFFMYAIDYLTKEKMDDKRILFYRDGFTYLEDYINKLIIPNDIKNIFLTQSSKKIEKIYITDYLEYLKSDNLEFIRSKNR